MNELHSPPPHKPHRPERRRAKEEHDIMHEEDIPIDAPDVEGQRMINDLRNSPAVKHPKAP